MGVRDRLLLAVLGTVAVALVTTTVVFNLVLDASLSSDADERLVQMALDESRTISVSPSGLVSLARPSGDIKQLGSQIWVFVGDITYSAPTVDPVIEAAAKALDGQPRQFADVPGYDVRLYGIPLENEGERIGTIVAGLSTASYTRTQRTTLVGTIAFTAVLLIVAKIKTEAELALRRERDPDYYQEALGSVLYSADQMARTVEALLAAAQEEGSLARGRADVWQVLADVVSSIGVLADEHEVEVRVQPPPRDLRVGVERDIAVQILRPVVENACRFARAEVLLRASRNGKEVYFLVEDDGPGVSEEEKERIFEPGVRGSASEKKTDGDRGTGLGLPLARRLARAASGDVDVRPGPTGAQFVVRLPSG